MEDLAGIGKVTEVILDKIAAVTGTLYEPTHVRRLGRAEAEVEANSIISRADAEMKVELLRLDHQSEITELENRIQQLRNRAGNRVLEQETRRQKNIEYIVGESLDFVRTSASNDATPREIDTDWMDAFIRYSQDISADGVRELWSKILAEQALEGRPSVSKVTLDALRLLEPKQARVFEKAAQMFMGMGQIMEADAFEETETSLNLNTMDVLALEDIGFVKRVHLEEYALDLRDGIMTFWNDYVQAPGLTKPGENRLTMHREWNNDESRGNVIDSIKGISSKNMRDTSGLRKSVKIDRLQLTSRGFELAAILFPDFYSIIELDDLSDCTQAGSYADSKFREMLILEWVKSFSSTSVVVVRNRAIDTSTSKVSSTALNPVAIFDPSKQNWINI